MGAEVERLKRELEQKSTSLKESSVLLDKHKQTLESNSKNISDTNAELLAKTKV